MRILWEYFRRILGLWIFWFWFVALDAVGLIFDTFVPDFSPPQWLYMAIPAVGFVVANVKLFADTAAEKQQLQRRLDDIEAQRANIRFRKLEDFVYKPSSHARSPFTDFIVTVDYHSNLRDNGLPGWIVIGARLNGMNKSSEPGELAWEVIEVSLPTLFSVSDDNPGSFQWTIESPLQEIKGWKDKFEAQYELPLKISLDDPQDFAQHLRSLRPYRVTISYKTLRGVDSESEAYTLVLEGNFEGLKRDLCKAWQGWGFRYLANIAGCTSEE